MQKGPKSFRKRLTATNPNSPIRSEKTGVVGIYFERGDIVSLNVAIQVQRSNLIVKKIKSQSGIVFKRFKEEKGRERD